MTENPFGDRFFSMARFGNPAAAYFLPASARVSDLEGDQADEDRQRLGADSYRFARLELQDDIQEAHNE